MLREVSTEANFGLFNASANGGGTAFFAHVGGFVFGVLVTAPYRPRPWVRQDDIGVKRSRRAGSSGKRPDTGPGDAHPLSVKYNQPCS